MMSSYKFNRLEVAGSLGDLGTLLPLAIGLILINGLNPTGLFLSVGLFYIASGIYYCVPIPVQPMKVIGAYSIATAMTASQITASGLLIGVILLVIGATDAITFIGRYIPKSVVRGVQLSTGTLLMVQGIKFMLGTSKLQMLQQSAEPFLMLNSIGPLPIGIIIGTAGGLLTLLLLDNKKIPAGLVVVSGGLALGLLFGDHETLNKVEPGIYFPQILPLGWPTSADFTFALFGLVLPQIPMTLGNAVIAYADLSKDYFGKHSDKVTYPAACITMGLANLFSSCVGGMPLCHGAGGLAAHYRFGARTGGSNLIIGLLFVLLAVLLGPHTLSAVNLLPISILGVLLIFAGSQLGLTIIELQGRKDFFVVLIILGITLASNLAAGFIVGTAVAHILSIERFKI